LKGGIPVMRSSVWRRTWEQHARLAAKSGYADQPMTGAARSYWLTVGELAGCAISGRPRISGSTVDTGATGVPDTTVAGAFNAFEDGATIRLVVTIGAGTTGTGADVVTVEAAGSGVLTTSLDLTGSVRTTVCR
jgi:hypothetical protein